MLKAIAGFSKVIAKYAYYPMLIGFIAVCSAFVYRGDAYSYVGMTVAVVCAVLTVLGFLSKKLCHMAGIDDKIR